MTETELTQLNGRLEAAVAAELLADDPAALAEWQSLVGL
jgi:hypothetical protein